jgi:hypothetical protein|tara:strand:- start:8125 stop:8412 length:288 start_codon:yes stop_codon:yes gene_type:complete
MQKWDTIVTGLLVGIISPLIILYGVNVFNFDHLSYALFLETGFTTGSLNPFLKIAALFNLAPFFLFINMNRIRTAQGIVFATILVGLVIVYFTLL